MTRTEARVCFAWFAGALLHEAHAQGIRVLITCVYRTPEEQERLRREGKSTVARSQHQEWLAIDLVEIDAAGQPMWHATPGLARLGAFWGALHPVCRWGGNWKTFVDVFHFEVSKAWMEHGEEP